MFLTAGPVHPTLLLHRRRSSSGSSLYVLVLVIFRPLTYVWAVSDSYSTANSIFLWGKPGPWNYFWCSTLSIIWLDQSTQRTIGTLLLLVLSEFIHLVWVDFTSRRDFVPPAVPERPLFPQAAAIRKSILICPSLNPVVPSQPVSECVWLLPRDDSLYFF